VAFDVIIFDPSISPITPVAIQFVIYYIGDPSQSVALPAFTTPNANLQIFYSVTNADGTSINPAIFSVTGSSLNVFTSSYSDAGVYSLLLTGYYSSTTPYKVSSPITITLAGPCMRNIILSQTIQD
jgi:hypothetical protein